MYSTWWGKTIGFGISPFSTWEGKRHNHEIKVKYQERPGRRRSMKKARSCVQYTIQKKKERSSREVLVWKDTGTWWLASLICKSFLLDSNKFRTMSRNPVRCRIFFFFFFVFFLFNMMEGTWFGLFDKWKNEEIKNGKWRKNALHSLMNPILCFVCFVFCSVRLLWGDPRSTRSFCHDIGQQLALRVFIFTYCCYMYWSRCQQTKYLYHSNFLCFFFKFLLLQSSLVFSEWISVEKKRIK